MSVRSVITMGKKKVVHDYIYFIAKTDFVSPLDCNCVHKYLMEMPQESTFLIIFCLYASGK